MKASMPSASLLDGPLDSVIKDPWASTAYSSQSVKSSTPRHDPWAELVDTQPASRVTASNDPWSDLRSSSPGEPRVLIELPNGAKSVFKFGVCIVS